MTETVKILTANRLADGAVVYGGVRGGWVERLGDAAGFAASTEADARLAKAAEDVADRLIVEPYLFDAQAGAHGLRPLRVREVIRAAGPTVRPDLGKQAEPGSPSAPGV